MAARLRHLQSKACQATQFLSRHGNSYYKQLIEQNKGYIQDPATVETCDRLAKQLFYTRLARLAFSGTHLLIIAAMWVFVQFPLVYWECCFLDIVASSM